jgi:hypothetical protein
VSLNLVLLPTPTATLVYSATGQVELYGPHATVWVLPSPRLVIDVPSDIVKNLFGVVADFVDRMFGQAEHPFLELFAEAPGAESWAALLQSAEAAVTVTDDQLQFRRWMAHPELLDRQAERLCLRYAGQSPVQVLKQVKLGAEFTANLGSKRYVSQGQFADQSHYIRTCRELTGYTPATLKKLSDLFYLRGVVFNKLAPAR